MPIVPKKKGYSVIRFIYMYLITAISIVLILISSIGLIRIVLNEYIFNVDPYFAFEEPWECSDDQLFFTFDARTGDRIIKETAPKDPEAMTAEKEECLANLEVTREARHINDIKRDLVTWISMLLVALPLYIYHWGVIQRENKKK